MTTDLPLPSLREAIELATSLYGWSDAEAALNHAESAMSSWLGEYVAARVAEASLPDPKGGCVCTAYSESRGGVYSEIVWEYEPACPEHSEHLYDPKIGVWVPRPEPLSRTGKSTQP